MTCLTSSHTFFFYLNASLHVFSGLFRKMSNEVIQRCCKAISLERIFDGFVTSSTKTLQECVDCCITWREAYDNQVGVVVVAYGVVDVVAYNVVYVVVVNVVSFC